MTNQLSIHGPILANTLGHCAGSLIFGTLLYLFFLDWYRSRRSRSQLSAIACGLAFTWNFGSIVAIALNSTGSSLVHTIITVSFSALTFLPAVLLHISLRTQHRFLIISGYVLSVASIVLHVLTSLVAPESLHQQAILLITFGFAVLSLISVILEMRHSGRAAGSRLAVAMALLLFAISFVHLGEIHPHTTWPFEILIHHAGVPLAVFVLLHDYRFLLLDAFLRLVVNGSLASVTVGAATLVAWRLHAFANFGWNPFIAAIAFVIVCLMLVGFEYVRLRVQRLVTRTVFKRSDVDSVQGLLRAESRSAVSESRYLDFACAQIARYVSADDFSLKDSVPPQFAELRFPLPLLERAQWQLFDSAPWAQVIVPIRFSRGDALFLFLGARQGGRPYLSEDLTVLSQLASIVVETVEQLRAMELQSLASQAELRALQAQINPHFLFNSLNTLYGIISRDDPEARRLVLNLSQVLRYFLQSERSFISVEEEMKIVRAYLEIEALRLGPKLQTRIEVDSDTLPVEVPVLSIQPLVENAVKHGVAKSSQKGFVHLRITILLGDLCVDITNSGPFISEQSAGAGGVGLANVKRRVELCYGADGDVILQADRNQTTVRLRIPLQRKSAKLKGLTEVADY
jgi:two-component system, LytTR family, sensor kinase